jgi:hypothetical protein
MSISTTSGRRARTISRPISAVGAVTSSMLARSSISPRMKAMFEGLSSM